jgi:hypothetical protein
MILKEDYERQEAAEIRHCLSFSEDGCTERQKPTAL